MIICPVCKQKNFEHIYKDSAFCCGSCNTNFKQLTENTLVVIPQTRAEIADYIRLKLDKYKYQVSSDLLNTIQKDILEVFV